MLALLGTLIVFILQLIGTGWPKNPPKSRFGPEFSFAVPPAHLGVCFTLNTPLGERFMLINRVLKLAAQFGVFPPRNFRPYRLRSDRSVIVMFLLAALRAWKRFREYRTPLMKVIYHGGIYYYSGIAGMSRSSRWMRSPKTQLMIR